MTNEETKEFVTRVFEKIESSKSIEDLEKIYEQLEIPQKNRIDTKTYPKINFKITHDEITYLTETGFLDSELNFTDDLSSKISEPITKLLYSLVWKNGDIKKIKHINQGIVDVSKKINEKENGLVFYQFGKFLTKEIGQPIIDQHVIRSFLVFNNTDKSKVSKIRKLNTLNKNYSEIIEKYKSWLISDYIHCELKRIVDYTYHIDKLLFSVGKTIKLSK